MKIAIKTVTIKEIDLDQIAKKHAILTDRNSHGEALKLLANAFGFECLAECVSKINEKHQQLGYLTEAIKAQRNFVDQWLSHLIYKKYPQAYDYLHEKGCLWGIT